MYRLRHIEQLLHDLLGTDSPIDLRSDLNISVPAVKIVRLIDQLGSYQDGFNDAKDLVQRRDKCK